MQRDSSYAGSGCYAAKLQQELMPKLTIAKDSDSVDGVSTDIGEELRHVLYHVKDSGLFDYLLDHD